MDESLNDVQIYCVEQFSRRIFVTTYIQIVLERDFVLEPEVISTLLAFFQAGGQPGTVIDLLTRNYYGNGQLANLMGTWLADLENDDTKIDINQNDNLSNAKEKIENCPAVVECFETTMGSLISKNFNPESADKIFETNGSEGIDWLPELISYRPWRQLIYDLAENYPNCLMLNFAVKLISDAGFQHEISNVNTAAQQLDIFSRVLLSSIDSLLIEFGNEGENSEFFQKNFSELMRIAAHSEQTFLVTQALLHEKGKISAVCAHISQLLRLKFKQSESKNICPLFVGMVIQSPDEKVEDLVNPNIVQAMLTMITKQALNPADIQTLYQQSKGELDFIRGKINELIKKLHDDELDLIYSLDSILKLIKIPVLAAGVLHFLKTLILRKLVLAEPQPIHFALIDQIVCEHSNIHSLVFETLCKLYDYQSTRNEASETIIARQRNIIDRFIHLFVHSSSMALVEKIQRMFNDGLLDVSLIRYFIVEVLEQIEAPYSEEFVCVFLSLVENTEIFDPATLEKNPVVKKFLKAEKKT